MAINPEQINILNIPELPEAASVQDNDLLVIGQGIFARKSTVIALYNKYGIPGIVTTLAGLQLQIDNISNSNSVLYTAQILSPPQQDQARDNINALSRTPNGNDQLIQGGLINPVYLSVDILTGVVKFVNDIEPDAEGKVYITIDDIPGLNDVIDDIINNQIVTQAFLENSVAYYKNANGDILFNIDWNEVIDDSFIRANMTSSEKEAFRFKIDAISASSMNDYLKVISTNYVANCNIAPLGHSYVNPSTTNMPDVDDLYGRLIVTSTNNSWIIQELQATNGMFFRRISTNAGVSFFSWTQFDPYSYARINGANIPSGTVWANLTSGNSNALGGIPYQSVEATDYDYIMVVFGGNLTRISKSQFLSLLPSAPSGSTSIIITGGSYQRAALTGDVTAAQNSNSTTIANNAVSNAKAADMPALTIKGNNTGSSSDPKDLTVSQAREMLGINNLEYKTEFRTFSGTTGIDVGGFNQYVARLISPIGSPSTFSISGATIHGMRLLLRIVPGSACTININYRTPEGSTGATFTTTDANTTVELIYDKNDDVFDYIGSTGSVPAT